MVFVVDKHHRPLMPCTERKARKLLDKGRAKVHLMYPFTIRIIDRLQENSYLQFNDIKIDPGSKETGIAIAREDEVLLGGRRFHVPEVITPLFKMVLVHKGALIHDRLQHRAMMRRTRRNRKIRYRQPRFDNRTREEGWLPPSIMRRVDSIVRWVKKLMKLVPPLRPSMSRAPSSIPS